MLLSATDWPSKRSFFQVKQGGPKVVPVRRLPSPCLNRRGAVVIPAGIKSTREQSSWRWGLSLFARFDLAGLLGRIRQGYFETTTTLGPDGLPLAGQTHFSSSQAVPVVAGQIGINWEPRKHTRLFLGSQAEYWWNVGRLSATGPTLFPARGQLADQGVYLRAEFNF
jgi:hypothetical protein